MNTNQKRILIAVIVLIVGMLLHPPFQRVASNGAIANMGYGWIFDPPGGNASVNVSILLIQWVAVLVVGGLVFFLAKESSPSNSPGPQGVGGWLLLLVAGMLALGPLLGAGRIARSIFSAEQQFPALKASEQWGAYTSVTWLVFLVAAVASIYGGWGLLRGNHRAVVDRAKSMLWISGPATSLVLGVLVPKMTMGEWNVDAQVVGGLIGSVIAAAIWTAYLSKSKRVRNTYSGPVASASISREVADPRPTPHVVTTTQMGSGQSVPLDPAPQESDDWAYEKVAEELETGNRDKATWTRAFAVTGGDDKQTTALYIKLRVEKLIDVTKSTAANTASPSEESTRPPSKAPVVDPGGSQEFTYSLITIGVAIGAVILLALVFWAKSTGALGPTLPPTAAADRLGQTDLPRTEALASAPAPLAEPAPRPRSTGIDLALLASLGPAALHPVMKDTCLTCHSLDRKVVGPSFRDIAARYKDRSDGVDILSSKIKKGGVGAWGTIPMPPNQHVPDGDIREIVVSILRIR